MIEEEEVNIGKARVFVSFACGLAAGQSTPEAESL
jgi:hypothetical protein